MKIYYIPLGSFCYPKIIIRNTNREYKESLPFDFHSSPHLNGITNILKELYETGSYNIELKEILEIYNENELCVSEKNMYFVHFFKTYDLIKNIDTFPVNAYTYINNDKINEVLNKFKKRFIRLYNILNDPNNIICFLRIENYMNYGWKYELNEFTHVLSLFKNPNKFLIYSQELIDDNLDYKKTNILNYEFHIPILFCKHYFYDKEFFNENKQVFIDLLIYFENLLNNPNIINIKYNNIIEKYYIDDKKKTIFKLSNLKYFSKYYIYNNVLYINNVIRGYDKYVKIENSDVYILVE
jgi:hypothetical protein